MYREEKKNVFDEKLFQLQIMDDDSNRLPGEMPRKESEHKKFRKLSDEINEEVTALMENKPQGSQNKVNIFEATFRSPNREYYSEQEKYRIRMTSMTHNKERLK